MSVKPSCFFYKTVDKRVDYYLHFAILATILVKLALHWNWIERYICGLIRITVKCTFYDKVQPRYRIPGCLW